MYINNAENDYSIWRNLEMKKELSRIQLKEKQLMNIKSHVLDYNIEEIF